MLFHEGRGETRVSYHPVSHAASCYLHWSHVFVTSLCSAQSSALGLLLSLHFYQELCVQHPAKHCKFLSTILKGWVQRIQQLYCIV